MTIKVSKKDKVLIERGVSIINSSRDLLERRVRPDLARFNWQGATATTQDRVSRRESLRMAQTGEVAALYRNGKFDALGFVDSDSMPHVLILEEIIKWKDGVCHCTACNTIRENGLDDPTLSDEEFKEKIEEVYPKVMAAKLKEEMLSILAGIEDIEGELSAFKSN